MYTVFKTLKIKTLEFWNFLFSDMNTILRVFE